MHVHCSGTVITRTLSCACTLQWYCHHTYTECTLQWYCHHTYTECTLQWYCILGMTSKNSWLQIQCIFKEASFKNLSSCRVLFSVHNPQQNPLLGTQQHPLLGTPTQLAHTVQSGSTHIPQWVQLKLKLDTTHHMPL